MKFLLFLMIGCGEIDDINIGRYYICKSEIECVTRKGQIKFPGPYVKICITTDVDVLEWYTFSVYEWIPEWIGCDLVQDYRIMGDCEPTPSSLGDYCIADL